MSDSMYWSFYWEMQCCGSGMFIPDPNFFHPGSGVKKRFRIPDPHQRISVFFTQKMFLSSRKYDPGCSSRIRTLIFYPSPKGHRIPDPEHRGDDNACLSRLMKTMLLSESDFHFVKNKTKWKLARKKCQCEPNPGPILSFEKKTKVGFNFYMRKLQQYLQNKKKWQFRCTV